MECSKFLSGKIYVGWKFQNLNLICTSTSDLVSPLIISSPLPMTSLSEYQVCPYFAQISSHLEGDHAIRNMQRIPFP